MGYHKSFTRKRFLGLSFIAHAFMAIFLIPGGLAATLPTLPQVYMDTTFSMPTGKTITVNSGGNFQTALNNAKLGDVIVLQAGATFQGPFTLPNKTTGSGWIYIFSSAYSNLPPPGTRVSPTDAANMPKIVGTSTGINAIKTATSSHHYRFVGIEIKPTTNNFLYNLIQIGNGDTSLSTLPNNIVFDRCYIHGDPSVGGRRGIAMDGISIAVIDSYISDFKEAGADTQAVWAYNSPGPLKIVNNYLEAAGENLMFGGTDPRIANLIPSDIEIRRNHFYKPLSWKTLSWTVKNLLEFKNAQRALVEGNTFENNWADAQNGFSILVTPRNQEGGAPWCVTKDITIRLNELINCAQGFNLSGQDNEYTSQHTYRILIENNVIDVTGGRMFQLVNGPHDVIINHNTGFSNGGFGFSENSPKSDQFVFTNNIVTRGSTGFSGTGTGQGTATLNYYYTNWTFTKNAIIGASSGIYPSGNYFPASKEAVGFVNYSGGDYHLSSSSPYKNAGTDSKDLGADIDAIEVAISGSTLNKENLLAPGNLRVIR